LWQSRLAPIFCFPFSCYFFLIEWEFLGFHLIKSFEDKEEKIDWQELERGLGKVQAIKTGL
jgi:hypothetical protein